MDKVGHRIKNLVNRGHSLCDTCLLEFCLHLEVLWHFFPLSTIQGPSSKSFYYIVILSSLWRVEDRSKLSKYIASANGPIKRVKYRIYKGCIHLVWKFELITLNLLPNRATDYGFQEVSYVFCFRRVLSHESLFLLKFIIYISFWGGWQGSSMKPLFLLYWVRVS
jgi:hypothetical protein